MEPIIGVDSKGRKTYTFNYTGRVVEWEVPDDLEQAIVICKGARGGKGDPRSTGSYPSVGGQGAFRSSKFNLVKGEVLKIIVGQKGEDYKASFSGGGGGGASYVIRSDGTPLIVAGGGGGAADQGVNGSNAPTGSPGDGEGGQGGAIIDYPSPLSTGSGGAGLYSDGKRGSASSNNFASTGGISPLDPTMPARGGRGYTDGSKARGGSGGFGGGGGAGMSGGGGGGYTGGDGGAHNENLSPPFRGGRGGTSFTATTFIDTGLNPDDNGQIVFIVDNQDPSITLDTSNNRTLYENDTYNISGTAQDSDAGDVVTVRYSINNGQERAIDTRISDGSSFSFNHTLTFRQGRLYRNDTAVTGELAEDTEHILRVWVEDDKGGKSNVEERSFFVVPFPSLGIKINSELKMSETGTVKVNGELRAIQRMWVKHNNVLREV